MLVGNAGSGKTVMIGDKLANLEEDKMVTTIPLNYYTTSMMLQQVMEKPLEKKAGKNYGPPGTKKLIYFIDDMNMPEVMHQLISAITVLVGLSGHVRSCPDMSDYVQTLYTLLSSIIYTIVCASLIG